MFVLPVAYNTKASAKSYACWKTRRGCTLAWTTNQASPVGAGGKRRHPRGDENTGLGADKARAQGAPDPGRRRGRRAERIDQARRAEDRRGSAGGRGRRGGGPRVLRERGGTGGRLSQWVPAEPPAHGRGRDRVRGAAGGRSRRDICLAGGRRAGGPDGRGGGAPGRRGRRRG